MSYAAIMVYVEPDETPEGRVRLAAGLADKFGATLIGLSARAIPPPVLANGLMMPAAPDITGMQAQLANRGSWFRRIADGDRRQVQWRSALGSCRCEGTIPRFNRVVSRSDKRSFKRKFPCHIGCMRKKLTAKTVENLPEAQGRRYEVWDVALPSFGIL